jgi:acyl-CoA thioester hydrolase
VQCLAIQTNSTCHAVRVQFVDTDLMGIVHHGTYLRYFEAGRIAYMRRRDVCYADWVGRGVHLPVVDLGVRYRRPAKFDQELMVSTWVSKLSRYAVRFDYQIHAVGLPDSARMVEGHTRLACVDDQGRLRPIPDEIAGRLAGREMISRPDDLV